MPTPEELAPLDVQGVMTKHTGIVQHQHHHTVLNAASIPYDPHLLELAPSPLYRVLVDYERHFRAHCTESELFQRAAAERHAIAQAKIAEQVAYSQNDDAQTRN